MEKYINLTETNFNDEERKEFNTIIAEYKESIPNFRKSIAITDELGDSFDITKHKLKTPNSCTPIMNIAEMFMQNALFDVYFYIGCH